MRLDQQDEARKLGFGKKIGTIDDEIRPSRGRMKILNIVGIASNNELGVTMGPAVITSQNSTPSVGSNLTELINKV